MAEAHLNTFFGASGFLGQLVQNSLGAFELWDKVERATESADEYITKLQFLRARLHWWTVCWGILDDQLSPTSHHAQLELYQDVIANYLRLISHTLQSLATYEDNTSIFKSTRIAITSSSIGRLATLLNPLSILQYSGSTGSLNDDDSTLRERLKWALASGRAMEHLKMLSDLIQDLESFLPPPDFGLKGSVLVNPALAANVWKLRWLSRQKDFDIFTISLAHLKATSLSLIDDIKVSVINNSSRLTGSLEYLRGSEARLVYLARYEGESVLVGRKKVSIMTNHTVLRARIEKVIRLLNTAQNIKELRTPPCLGYVYTQSEEGATSQSSEECIYEILYSFNGTHVISLQDMLRCKLKLPLHKRFDVAKSLARSILYLHTAEWLHKGIRSSNVVFSSKDPFPESHDYSLKSSRLFADVSLPYLVGFEYSRVNSHDEGTEHVVDTLENNLYRHPDVQGEPSSCPGSYLGDSPRFSKNHDIYSLGVILLELGLYRPASHIQKKLARPIKDGKETRDKGQAPKFQEKYGDILYPEVQFNMGAIYAEVISHCLKGNFYRPGVAYDQEGAVAFYRDVVAQLERCNA